ncbi:hypothetical protein VII00023_08049 [Vibrio ichthyoenteri ATCC 700023]|uniref:Putative adhesin Stv domain-containing protein n=1 Tax=Vibrio ichthyoenteri ATCC 700023 TaxID=870968 RepID=F9RZX1_9VIBR|nr:hypothetical protein [Vibrio ichthyoenteri]EGU44194.1 hypothetical protein VII00023_08049 [Vibrio ichthyoenteri ATCC 700023]
MPLGNVSSINNVVGSYGLDKKDVKTSELAKQINRINNLPSVFELGGVTISRSGTARQLVIMSHGGWKEFESSATLFRRQVGDGWTNVPQGLRVDFYTEDKNFTKGASVITEVSKRPEEALQGLSCQLGISDSDLELLASSRNTSMAAIRTEMEQFAVYKKDGVVAGEKVKNYALYHHENTESMLKGHQRSRMSEDVDIAFITDKKHKCHLSDVFKAIRASGHSYEVVHFGACRVERTEKAVPNL